MKTTKFVPFEKRATCEQRPEWQYDRGERFGNQRKAKAEEKREARRLDRTRSKREAIDY